MVKINTNQPGTEKHLRKPRILVAPLDWGLGHATRCIPIIRELLIQGADVCLAGEGQQQELLQQEFPELTFLPLRGYQIRYGRSRIGLLVSIIRQISKIHSAIKWENEWLKKMIAAHKLDAVISDNRYGLYNPGIPCIFITHQLAIKSPSGIWTEKLLQKKNYRYINQFTECWVPDSENDNNLGGTLSHPKIKPAIPVYYIGPLSRFQLVDEVLKKKHLLVVLSGPEPQRSILENKVIKEIAHYPSTATIVRGLPGSDSIIPSTSMIKFYNHLTADELNKEMMKAEFVISRSGYSTIMDVIKLKKKNILIPTPGQTEQEYLANYLSKKKIAFCVSQKGFSLNAALTEAVQFSYQTSFPDSGSLMEPVVSKLLSSLSLR